MRKSKHIPDGYSAEVSGLLRIQPGTDALFSVPFNHVDDDWHLQLELALDVDGRSIYSGPFTYLPFYKWDIPKEMHPSESAHH